jgi:hypothetical protein
MLATSLVDLVGWPDLAPRPDRVWTLALQDEAQPLSRAIP